MHTTAVVVVVVVADVVTVGGPVVVDGVMGVVVAARSVACAVGPVVVVVRVADAGVTIGAVRLTARTVEVEQLLSVGLQVLVGVAAARCKYWRSSSSSKALRIQKRPSLQQGAGRLCEE